MAQLTFNNKKIVLPGAYSTIISGETGVTRTADWGTVLIIDTGTYSAGFGGGGGINGTLTNGQNAIYTFSRVNDFRNFVRGGMWWRCAEVLFAPDNSNPQAGGASQVMFVRAATTTPATLTFTTTAGGTFECQTIDEGLVANGKMAGDILSVGYGMSIEAGVYNTEAHILKFWRGTYTGTYEGDGLPFGDETETQAKPILVLQTGEFTTMDELLDWCKKDSSFNQLFKLTSNAESEGTGEISGSDISTAWDDNTYILATGATETFNATDLTAVLEQIVGLDYSFVTLDQVGANANSANVQSYLAHLSTESKFQHTLFLAGYDTKADFSKSITLAQGFNSEWVCLTHGGVGKVSAFDSSQVRWWPAIYNMCAQMGRCAGKAPYVPLTNKTIGVDRLQHSLTEAEKEQAVNNGVLVTVLNDYTKNFVVLIGCNTLQDNQTLFNANGQSASIQFMRIVAQINKELVINAELDLLSQENGVNSNTLSAGAVKDWTVAYLQSRVATTAQDNLLLSFKDVETVKQEDAYYTTYKIVVNNEINKLFFTGYLIRG